jgi:GNAT superfamily N-acetyltransferase
MERVISDEPDFSFHMLPQGTVVVATAGMPDVSYRRLRRADTTRLGEIDRSEHIEAIYYLRDGKLELEDEHHELNGWPPGVLEKEAVHQLELFDRGGIIYGAFFGERLVGYMSMDTRPVCGRLDRLLLDLLHVDSCFRRRGIGCRLLEHARSIAKEMGATSIYVSATPSRNTVGFYLRRGFVPTEELDPEQHAREPYDIHMVLEL